MESEDPSEFFDSLVWDGMDPPPSEEDVDEPIMRKCSKCQEEKTLDFFHKGGAYCKSCRKEYDAARNTRVDRKRPAESERVSEIDDPEREVEPDSLYIMSNSWRADIVKIGRSSNPEDRARQMNTSHPFRLTIERSYGGMGFIEKTLHDRLKHRRVEGGPGREWFTLSAAQADTLIRASIVDHELAREPRTKAAGEMPRLLDVLPDW